ncbi:MAG: phosphoglucomutase/phosphomannomutase family protein [Ruminococcaceae bacterium]|nr:phosphoglucomutase/phosphomannomutase family protein [Oscillospiraceae bacterium]
MIKFGTGGWRAVIGSDFVEKNICYVAEGICRLMEEDGKMDKPTIIGYDHRFLSEPAARWMAEVFAAHGLTVWFMNRSAPTPLIMHTVKKQGFYFGVEITASHNPSSYNGIKLIVEEGRDAPVETTVRLEAWIACAEADDKVGRMPFAEACDRGLVIYRKNPFNDFIDDILNVLNVEAIREHGARVLFDPMYGSGTYPLLVILCTARCTVDMIHNTRDAYFGGHLPAPSAQGLGELRNRVLAGKYELGIAFDGDGDRLGIIDRDGRYITANEILVMLYWYLHEIKGWRGPVVRNLATTHMLDVMAADFGETCHEVPVGFKYISSKIDEADAILGGESSGGLTVRGHIHGKDSVYAASLFVEMLSVVEKSPSQIMNELEQKYGHYDMVEDNITFTTEQKTAVNRIIFEEKKIPFFGKPVARVSYEDGCKVYFGDNSFVICRFSGTEPLLRIFAEASDAATAKGYIEAFRDLLAFD